MAYVCTYLQTVNVARENDHITTTCSIILLYYYNFLHYLIILLQLSPLSCYITTTFSIFLLYYYNFLHYLLPMPEWYKKQKLFSPLQNGMQVRCHIQLIVEVKERRKLLILLIVEVKERRKLFILLIVEIKNGGNPLFYWL